MKLLHKFNMPKNITMVQWYKYQIFQCQKTIELLIKGNRNEIMETKGAAITIINIYNMNHNKRWLVNNLDYW